MMHGLAQGGGREMVKYVHGLEVFWRQNWLGFADKMKKVMIQKYVQNCYKEGFSGIYRKETCLVRPVTLM